MLIRRPSTPASMAGGTSRLGLPAASADPVARAVHLFRDRHADRLQKRTACVLLAGELERLRPLVKEHLLGKDEGMLFTLANQYAVRHQNADQRDDYADECLDWVFWTFLATVDLVRWLAER